MSKPPSRPCTAGWARACVSPRFSKALFALVALVGPEQHRPCAQEPGSGYDAILSWEGERHGTLGPTGRALFAARMDTAPGFRGTFGYAQTTPGFVDPVILEFYRDRVRQELEPCGSTWFPSHLRAVWSGAGIEVEEVKFITEDDFLIDRIRIGNASREELDLEVFLRGNMTPLRERIRSRQISVALSESANVRTDVRSGIPLEPGTIEYDSVAFSIPDPGEGPNAVALRGTAEWPFRALPDAAQLTVPDVRPALATLHLLVATLPTEQGRDRPAARFEFRFDDGSVEALAWPPAARGTALPAAERGLDGRDGRGSALHSDDHERKEWRFLRLPGIAAATMRLSYVPPPGRFIQSVGLVKEEDSQPAVLLAATFEIPPDTGRLPVLLGRPDFHGLPVHLALAGQEFTSGYTPRGERALLRRVHLEPGGAVTFNAALATGAKRLPTVLAALERVERRDVFERHRRRYGAWFDELPPDFTCSDALMEKAWRYRWYLVRHNMMRLEQAGYSLPVFYESLGDPARAWVSTRSSAEVLSEVRWLADPALAHGQIRLLLQRQLPDGLLHDVRIGERGASHASPIPAAAIGVFEVSGSTQYLKEVLPLLRRNVDGLLAAHDADGDLLPALSEASQTGMDGLPSFLRLAGADSGSEVRMERVEYASYLYASARALAEGFRELEEADAAERYAGVAEQVREAVLSRMWSEKEAFFFPVRELDHEPVRCREITGFQPFAAMLVPDEPRYRRALSSLTDPGAFWAPHPLATVARSDPAFVPSPRPPSTSGAGPDELLWRGAAWPRANGMAAEAMATALRYYGPSAVTREDLSRLLAAITRMQFEGGDPDRPLVRRCYDAETGLASGPADCFDSVYNDLLIRLVGGVVPRRDGAIELWPLVTHLEHFAFRGIPYHGRRLDITWDRPDGTRVYAHAPEGYTLAIDGVQRLTLTSLRRIVVD